MRTSAATHVSSATQCTALDHPLLQGQLLPHHVAFHQMSLATSEKDCHSSDRAVKASSSSSYTAGLSGMIPTPVLTLDLGFSVSRSHSLDSSTATQARVVSVSETLETYGLSLQGLSLTPSCEQKQGSGMACVSGSSFPLTRQYRQVVESLPSQPSCLDGGEGSTEKLPTGGLRLMGLHFHHSRGTTMVVATVLGGKISLVQSFEQNEKDETEESEQSYTAEVSMEKLLTTTTDIAVSEATTSHHSTVSDGSGGTIEHTSETKVEASQETGPEVVNGDRDSAGSQYAKGEAAKGLDSVMTVAKGAMDAASGAHLKLQFGMQSKQSRSAAASDALDRVQTEVSGGIVGLTSVALSPEGGVSGSEAASAEIQGVSHWVGSVQSGGTP